MNIKNLCRDRTVLLNESNNSIGLSLSAFISKRGREGPIQGEKRNIWKYIIRGRSKRKKWKI